MITRCALGLALVLGSACVPWTSMAPDKPAVRLLLDLVLRPSELYSIVPLAGS